MSEGVIAVELISSATLIINALIAATSGVILAKLNKTKRDVEATKEQIINHHEVSPNLREQQDERYEETKKWFKLLYRKIGRVEKHVDEKLSGVNDTTDMLTTIALENRERLDKIEEWKNNEHS